MCAAHPHPGNLQRTPDGQLAILDFGLMSRVDENIKYGMIEAISHLIHRDYEAIVEDFVTLEFIPPGTDLSPILPVLAKVLPYTCKISLSKQNQLAAAEHVHEFTSFSNFELHCKRAVFGCCTEDNWLVQFLNCVGHFTIMELVLWDTSIFFILLLLISADSCLSCKMATNF